MATAFQVHNVPASIRAQYDSLPEGVGTVHMAKDVPRQYQRNSEDLKILKFPSTKNILWDHASTGEPHMLQLSYYRQPKLCIGEKVLRFAQRHAGSTGQGSCSSALVGSVSVTDDGQGVVFNVERFDPTGDANTSINQAVGDILIPFTVSAAVNLQENLNFEALVQSGSKERGSSLEEYTSAAKLLKQRCCSNDVMELGNFMSVRGWCSVYAGSSDKCVHHLEFDVVTIGTEIKAQPIEPVPIVPTALSKNLSGPLSVSHMQGVPKTGYLTMDHTRKLILVLEAEPKVVNLPLVGIWVSGVSYAYSPYIWACCLRFLHNSVIQNRACSPPDPFLLVLYNPTHSKPEFYECSTASGSSALQFELYSGYEAVHISKTGDSSRETVEVELESVQTGGKRDLFEEAARKFTARGSLDDSRRSLSPELTRQDDITPRLKPAPYQSKTTMMQSMVPEVSMFLGDEMFVPNLQHPKEGNAARHAFVKPEVHQSTVPRSVPHTASHSPTSDTGSIQRGGTLSSGGKDRDIKKMHQQIRTSYGGLGSNPSPASVAGGQEYGGTNGAFQARSSQAMPLATQYTPETFHPPMMPSVKNPHTSVPMQHPHSAPVLQGTIPQPQSQLPQTQQNHRMPYVSQQSYPGYSSAPINQGPRPDFCSCPNCPRPPHYTNGPQSSNFVRGHPPRPTYSNFGHPPPPRLSGPFGCPPGAHMGYPYAPPTGHQSYPQVNERIPASMAPPVHSNAQAFGMNILQSHSSQEQVTHSSSSPEATGQMGGMSSHSQQVRPCASQQLQPMNRMMSPPLPQASGGGPTLSKERTLSPESQQQYSERTKPAAPVRRANEGQRSNPASDNSARSSGDSGLSVTPENHNSPSTPNPKTIQVIPQSTVEPRGAGLSLPSVNWDNIPPEIYQLLQTQQQQLKQLQAKVDELTAQQSLNTTAEMQQTSKTSPRSIVPEHDSPVPKHTAATNTSVGLMTGHEQISACMQTSPQKHSSHNSTRNSHDSSGSGHLVMNRSLSRSSNSSGSACGETCTPMEIRHRGYQPRNSTHCLEEQELEMSQGELVALMNNLHNETLESEQSAVELPSFQSSLTGLMRSEESYEETTFNTSQQSPRSAGGGYVQPVSDSEGSDYTDEDENSRDNTGGTDNPDYYNKLKDNIKKMLGTQNTTEEISEDTDYLGDISSVPNTPIGLAKEDIHLGQHLQSFVKYDGNNSYNTEYSAYTPKINYVSMLLDSDNDTSMEINAMAMKYLKDEQLTQFTKMHARNRLMQGSKQPGQKNVLLQKILKAENDQTPNVTAFGMSPNNLTFSTKQYMERHKLFEDQVSGESTPACESTYNESYQLKTNYSTMSSGSDGPAQITQDILSTPTNQQVRSQHVITPQRGPTSEGVCGNEATPNREYNNTRTTVNNDSPGGRLNLTPRPTTVRSRVADHKRFTPNAINSQNDSGLQSVHDQQFVQGGAVPRTDIDKYGAGGRFASPQFTPASSRPKHSPPQRVASSEPRRCVKDVRKDNAEHMHRRTDEHERQPVFKRNPILENQGGPNVVNNPRETSEDERILDITRLKQLPKLL